MSRVFWDTMLIIYLLEEHPVFAPRVRQLLLRTRQRGDRLCTSYLAVGEVLAGADVSLQPAKERILRQDLDQMGFEFLPFDSGAVAPFSRLRAKERLKIADSIHLACAASAGIDLFLTGDKQLTKLDIPGIQFIAEFNTPLL